MWWDEEGGRNRDFGWGLTELYTRPSRVSHLHTHTKCWLFNLVYVNSANFPEDGSQVLAGGKTWLFLMSTEMPLGLRSWSLSRREKSELDK